MSDNLKKLREKAKRRGIKNFGAKTEAELRELLEKRGTKSQPMHPIPTPRRDFSERSIPAPRNIPILQPEIAVVEKDKAPSFIKKTIETFSGWMNWLVESGQKYIIKPITSTLKNLKEKINKIFEEEKEEEKEKKKSLN